MTRYSLSAVNMLTSSPNSDLTKKDFFKLNFTRNDENIGQNCFTADFSSFEESLTR